MNSIDVCNHTKVWAATEFSKIGGLAGCVMTKTTGKARVIEKGNNFVSMENPHYQIEETLINLECSELLY